MIFLNPAVLFGLLAASIPVLIHLLNLRKLKRIEFSTLAFLKELQKNKIRKIKLKQWLLLALRMLIILFLVTAFARPTLKGVAIGGTTSAAKTTAVFILDNTPSMSVVDSKGSYFNQAKSVIKQLLGQLQEGDDAALILVSDHTGNEIKTTTNLADFQKQIDGAKISDESGYINDAIVKSAKVLSQSQNYNKEIYLLSDFQQGRLSAPGSVSDFGQILNNKVRLYGFNFSGKEVYNLGIDQLQLNTQIFESNKPVNFAATVRNYSTQHVGNLVVSLFINGERSAQQSISLSPQESKIAVMDAEIKTSGYVNVYAEIEDDEILQDNKRYINFFIPKEIPVVLFSDTQSDSRFVNLALTAVNLNQNQNSSMGQTTGSLKIIQKDINQISALDLSQYDVVIIIGTGNGNISGLNRLKTFIDNGGNVLLMPGENTSPQNYQKVTNGLNIPSPTGTAGGVSNTGNAVRFDKIDFNHPVFKDIFSNTEKKNIESPDVYYHFKINPEGKGESIISLTDGTSFLAEYKFGKGKIFCFNTAPVLSWSNFPLRGIFAPLMNKSVFYLAAKNESISEVIAGQPVLINLRNNVSPQIKIIRPDKSEDFINLQDETSSNYYEYKKTDLAGSYTVYSGSKIIYEFSVNLDPQESVVKYISANEFENYLKQINFKGKYIQVEKNEDPAKVVLQSRFGSELWRYFLVIAILLALIEMAVARNAKKELIDTTN